MEHKRFADFFELVYQRFHQAQSSTGDSIDFCYNVAGQIVKVCFAGHAMASLLTPALEHLIIDPHSEAQLTVCCWDSVTTGVDFPDPPWSVKDYTPRGEIQGFNNHRFRTVYKSWIGVLSMVDLEGSLAIYWIHDAQKLPFYEKAAPFLHLLSMSLGNHQRQTIHGAAVGCSEGGVLLVGRNSSGKSSASLACLDSKLRFSGDDYCSVSCEESPYVYSLYSAAKLNPEDKNKFPFLERTLDKGTLDEEKVIFFLNKIYPEKIINRFPLKAILLARISGRHETALKPTSPAEAIKAIAPSTIVQLPGMGQQALHAMGNLSKRVPCYIIELGTDVTQIPTKILELLSKK